MKGMLRRLIADDRGISALEYIALGALGAYFLYGVLMQVFDSLRAKLSDVAGQL